MQLIWWRSRFDDAPGPRRGPFVARPPIFHMTLPDDSESSAGVDPITTQVHHPYAPPTGFAAFAPPVHKASTVLFPSLEALRGRGSEAASG